MCNAVILNLLESLLISQYVCGVVAIQCCGIFTIVQQRSLKLAFFVGIYLPYLVPPCLRSELNALLLRLLHESMNSPELSASESKAALEAIVCLLRPMLHHQEAQPSRRDKQFQKIMALIDESIQAEHLRPEWLASETGMSVRSLYRLFAEKGLVVAQYIKNRRLDLCARALQSAHDDEKLAGIGYSWGFSDHSHFSTAFKQRFGVSPGEYRKRCR